MDNTLFHEHQGTHATAGAGGVLKQEQVPAEPHFITTDD